MPIPENLNEWFATPLGKRLLHEEKRALEQILPHLFGYYLVQIGCAGQGELLHSARIGHRFLSAIPRQSCLCSAHLQTDAEALPFANDSVDVVVLNHVLEFESEPHQVLREAERILIPEGHLVLIGFNPFSLWGLRGLAPWRAGPPWNGRFRGLPRIQDWLSLLGFSVLSRHMLFMPLPLQKAGIFSNFNYLAKKQQWWSYCGDVYILLAKKRVATLTPIKPRWLRDSVLGGKKAVRPTMRG